MPPKRPGAYWSPIISARDPRHAATKALEMWPEREVVEVLEYAHAGLARRDDDLDA